MAVPSKALLEEFIGIVGPSHAFDNSHDLSHYTDENRGIFVGNTPLVLKPGSVEEVISIVKLAAKTGTALVPQGGHTGHAAGGAPREQGTDLVVSLQRLNKVRELDLLGNTLTVEAGVILQTIQELADDNDRLFPLALGSQGSCMIGGNISTNAGGTGVLAYGNTRDLVIGLEVVLPSGELWSGLRVLKKDNTGYDLKNLFIGAEGTLGIITAAVVKLFPKPVTREVAFVGLKSPDAALEFFQVARQAGGRSLTTFEIIPRIGLEFVTSYSDQMKHPLESWHPWYVMIEISSSRSVEEASSMLLQILEDGLGGGSVCDAAVAQSVAQQKEFWRIRETLPPSQAPNGASIKHDISVPVHKIPEFYRLADEIVAREIPGARPCAFGHMGDGNIHYNITRPEAWSDEEFMKHRKSINQKVHQLVVEMGGSISAEHGIGQMKRDELAEIKDPVELALMHRIKQTLDPGGIMNPGKVLQSS